MTADPGRRSGSHRLTWGQLRHSRTLIPEVVVYTPSGQERIIEIPRKQDLLLLLRAGFACLEVLEHAEQVRRARQGGDE